MIIASKLGFWYLARTLITYEITNDRERIIKNGANYESFRTPISFLLCYGISRCLNLDVLWIRISCSSIVVNILIRTEMWCIWVFILQVLMITFEYQSWLCFCLRSESWSSKINFLKIDNQFWAYLFNDIIWNEGNIYSLPCFSSKLRSNRCVAQEYLHCE